jgi:hypothetical protein
MQVGVPVHIIHSKMTTAGLNPDYLENPNIRILLESG